MAEYRHDAKTPYHISCGGAVYRQQAGKTDVIVLVRNAANGTKSYHLPKGTLHHNETLEHCAEREIREESGHEGDIMGYLGAFTDQFTKNSIAIDKTTHYFAVQWRRHAGSHDAEHDEVVWKDIAAARELLETTERNKKEYIILDRLKDFLITEK